MECTEDPTLPPGQTERRKTRDCPYMTQIDDRMNHGESRMQRIEESLNANCADTAEVLDILRLGRSFFRMAAGIGAFIKWGAAILAPVLAVWFSWKSGAGKQ